MGVGLIWLSAIFSAIMCYVVMQSGFGIYVYFWTKYWLLFSLVCSRPGFCHEGGFADKGSLYSTSEGWAVYASAVGRILLELYLVIGWQLGGGSWRAWRDRTNIIGGL